MKAVHGQQVIKRLTAAGVAVLLAGCTTVDHGRTVTAGDRVGIRFTCRLPDGAVAMSSEKSVADDHALKKAPVFIPRNSAELLVVEAGGDPAYQAREISSFEEDGIQRVAELLPGWHEGESREITLASSPVVRGGTLRLARIRKASKERRFTVEEFRSSTGKEPEAGQTVMISSELPGRVSQVSDGTVVITFAAADGTLVQTPVGPGRVRDAGGHYDIVIEARQGELLRMGPLVGRVTYLDEQNLDVDFSATLGGESLRCAVNVATVTEKADGKAAQVEPATGTAAAASPAGTESAAAPSGQDLERGVGLLQQAVVAAVRSGQTSMSLDADSFPAKAAQGDLVTISFSLSSTDGTPLQLPAALDRLAGSQEIRAGSDELFPGLGAAVVDMAAGEKKRLTLPPEKAFGPRNPANQVSYSRKNVVPASLSFTAEEYVKRFGGFPAIGRDVPVSPYLTARVSAIGDNEVILAVTATSEAEYKETYGTVTTVSGEKEITVNLTPQQGAPFTAGDKEGVISGVDAESFSVDFNHPLVGRTIVVDLEVQQVKVSSALDYKAIAWQENHDASLAKARAEGKPLFLFLYADWCTWCRKTHDETLTDPRIRALQDRFVWVKVNSDKEKRYMEMYGQNGYPLMLILSADGRVVQRIDGYRDAAGLSHILKSVVEPPRSAVAVDRRREPA